MSKYVVIKDTQEGREALHAAGYRWMSGHAMDEWGRQYIGKKGHKLAFDLENDRKRAFIGGSKKTHKVVKIADGVFVFMPRKSTVEEEK